MYWQASTVCSSQYHQWRVSESVVCDEKANITFKCDEQIYLKLNYKQVVNYSRSMSTAH